MGTAATFWHVPAAKSGLSSASLTLSKWNTGGRWDCTFELGFDLTQQNPKTQKQAQCKQCLAAPQRKQAQTGFPELWKAVPDSHMGMKGSRKRKHGEHHPDFEIPKSSLSPKGTKKAQSLPKSQGCSQILVWPCTQALQGSAPGWWQPFVSAQGHPYSHYLKHRTSKAFPLLWLLSTPKCGYYQLFSL